MGFRLSLLEFRAVTMRQAIGIDHPDQRPIPYQESRDHPPIPHKRIRVVLQMQVQLW